MFTQRQWKMIEHAYTTVPFYINLQHIKGIDYRDFKSWDDIPVTTKEDLVLNEDSFISSNAIIRCMQDDLICCHTSGSTGESKNIYWSNEDMNYSLSPLWLKRKRYYGINPHDKHCYFFTTRSYGREDVPIEDKGYALGFNKCNLSEERLKEIWKTMQEFSPVWMNLQPSIALLLCDVVKKNDLGRIPSLRYMEVTVEMLTTDMRAYIENTLQVKVVNQYGTIEMNSIAFEYPDGTMRCMNENCYLEVLDSKNRSVSANTTGNLCVTTLTNYSMPLIRYKMDDIGSLAYDGNTKTLTLLSGRSSEYAVDSEGNKINVYVFARAVENVNCLMEHSIIQFQIIQRDVDSFLVRIVLDEDYREEEIVDAFLDNIWQDSLREAEFTFEFTDKMFPSEETGKHKWFINEINK